MIKYLPTKSAEPLLQGYTPQYSLLKSSTSTSQVSETPSDSSEAPKTEEPQNFFTIPIWDVSSTASTSKIYENRSDFVLDLSKAYTAELKRRGIDTKYAKYLIAQDALESAWGTKYSGNFNFGNITVPKGSSASYTEGADTDGKGNPITQKFRNYNSMDEWVSAKIDLLSNKRYNAFSGDSSPEAFYTRVKQGGYATDPNYVKKLMKMINSPILQTLT